MSRIAIGSVVWLSLVLAPLGLRATVSVPMEFRQVVADASVIVQGHVTDVRAVAMPNRTIDTIATVAATSYLKGDAGPFVSVRVPGGTIGRTKFVMVDAPRLQKNEQAVFLLKRSADGAWRPVGLSMGIYPIQVDPRTGATTIDPPLVSGQTATAASPVVRGDSRRRLMSTKEFLSLVHLVMAAQAAAGTPER